MDNKEELLNTVKNWIEIDNNIKQLQKQTKELRKEKKELTNSLVNIMKSNEIDCFDLQDNKLIYTKRTVKSSLSKKVLLSALSTYFKNDNDTVGKLTEHILNSREEKIKENIRRK
tara:strand:+ start:871 stop:1215 length:345 start_codon:yes stop_codon:yes gene_type:complete